MTDEHYRYVVAVNAGWTGERPLRADGLVRATKEHATQQHVQHRRIPCVLVTFGWTT